MPTLCSCEWDDLDRLLWAQRQRLTDTGEVPGRHVHGGYEMRKPDLEHTEMRTFRRWCERRGARPQWGGRD